VIPLTKELSDTLKNATIYHDAAGHRVRMCSPMRGSVSALCGGPLRRCVVRWGLPTRCFTIDGTPL
jgi:hypothetical protein